MEENDEASKVQGYLTSALNKRQLELTQISEQLHTADRGGKTRKGAWPLCSVMTDSTWKDRLPPVGRYLNQHCQLSKRGEFPFGGSERQNSRNLKTDWNNEGKLHVICYTQKKRKKSNENPISVPARMFFSSFLVKVLFKLLIFKSYQFTLKKPLYVHTSVWMCK